MTVGLGGSIPQINRSGITPGSKPLFHSVRDIALILDKSFKAGYGYLRAGTVMALNTVDNSLVPYPETAFTANAGNGKAFLVANGANATVLVSVTNPESYKFRVGDELVIEDDTTAAEDLGAIVSIVRGANGIAVITVTDAIGGAAFTTVRSACVYCKSALAGRFAAAAYILDQDINTGYGEDALGANSSVVVSNAVLYGTALVNIDAAAVIALGARVDGRFLILT